VLAGILYYVFYRMQRDRTDEVMVVPN